MNSTQTKLPAMASCGSSPSTRRGVACHHNGGDADDRPGPRFHHCHQHQLPLHGQSGQSVARLLPGALGGASRDRNDCGRCAPKRALQHIRGWTACSRCGRCHCRHCRWMEAGPRFRSSMKRASSTSTNWWAQTVRSISLLSKPSAPCLPSSASTPPRSFLRSSTGSTPTVSIPPVAPNPTITCAWSRRMKHATARCRPSATCG